jgi:hypothetical protein
MAFGMDTVTLSSSLKVMPSADHDEVNTSPVLVRRTHRGAVPLSVQQRRDAVPQFLARGASAQAGVQKGVVSASVCNCDAPCASFVPFRDGPFTLTTAGIMLLV